MNALHCSVFTMATFLVQNDWYWLELLTHLQRDSVPGKSVDALRDVVHMHEAATLDDMTEALQQFDFGDNNAFTCIGVSGKQPLAALPFEQQNAGNLKSVNAYFNEASPDSKESNGIGLFVDVYTLGNAAISAFKRTAQNVLRSR